MGKKKNKDKNNFKRISENAKKEKFIELGKKIEQGKAKIVCYSIDGNVGYFYYKEN